MSQEPPKKRRPYFCFNLPMWSHNGIRSSPYFRHCVSFFNNFHMNIRIISTSSVFLKKIIFLRRSILLFLPVFFVIPYRYALVIPRVSWVTPKMSQNFDLMYFNKIDKSHLFANNEQISNFAGAKFSNFTGASEKACELNRKSQQNPN